MGRALRLFRDAPLDGAANMARDEALLTSIAAGALPAVRLYAWRRPTLSLGAHQSSDDADLDACRRLGVDLVRRPTGGSAVLHDDEVTYSVAGRLGEGAFATSVTGNYERIAQALVAGLALLSVPAEAARHARPGGAAPPADCFARPARREILVAGRKLVGSAQVRRRGAFLQHGSILLGYDGERMRSVLAREQRAPAPPPPAPPSPAPAPPMTLGEWSAGRITREDLEEALIAGFERALQARLVPSSGLDPAEAEHAARLRAFKYLDARWTLDGRVRPMPA